MVKASEIRDEKSLETWIEGRPRRDAVVITQRAALRVLPLVAAFPQFADTDVELAVIVVFRALLTSGAANKTPTREVITAAAEAAVRANALRAVIRAYNAHAAASGPLAAVRAAIMAAASFASPTAAAHAAAATIFFEAEPIAWKQVSEDAERLEAGDDLAAVSLWSITHPDWFQRIDGGMRAYFQSADPESWTFWQRWWDGVLSGRQLPWDLQEKVALIPNEIWEQGVEAVAEEIAKRELEFARQATPNAEEIIINDEGRYEAVPRSNLPAQTLQDARDRIGDTVRLIRAVEAQNQYVALVPEADLLDEAVKRYGGNALRLHETCYKVVRHVGTNIANGVLPENDNLVRDVVVDLQNAADDIYNFDDEVRKTVDARSKLRFSRMEETQKAQVQELALVVADRSARQLAEDLREDAAAVLEEREPTDDTALNRYRLGSRLSRVASLGGKIFKDVTEALRWVSGVSGGLVVLAMIILALLSLI